MYQYQELTPFPTHDVIKRASILGSQLAGRDGSGFGRFMYQYQELTPFPQTGGVALAALCINIKN